MASDGINPMQSTHNAPRCGAKTRRGTACRSPAMKNGRCRMHGGKSPGAPCDNENGNFRHGLRTQEAIKDRKRYAQLLRNCRALLKEVNRS